MHVDRGCCRVHCVSSVEQLFGKWTDRVMLVRLDIFHWIHHFNAAMRTDHQNMPFKSALSAVVFAYNKDDTALLVQAIRAGHPTSYANLTDSQIIESHVSKNDLIDDNLPLCQEDHSRHPGNLRACSECH